MTSKSKSYCSVPQCNTYRTSEITMHLFPKDTVLREKWAVALRIGKKVTKGMMVCSQHFEASDFFPANQYTKKRFLKKQVIPSKRIPVRSHDPKPKPGSTSARSVRLENRKKQCASTPAELIKTEAVEEVLPQIIINNLNEKHFSDVAVQVNILRECQKNQDFHIYLLSSSAKLNVFTGVSLKVYKTIYKVVLNTLKYFPDLNNKNIDKKLCLVLTKLKLDLSFHDLGILYEVSSTTAQNCFHTWIQVLYYSLKPAIHFPTKEENLKNLPLCIQKYEKVRIIINAIEVPVQRTKCLHCKIRSYSHCKKSPTAKFLISVSPAGFITHVSAAYGGHVSDKAIFNEEGIINLLDPLQDAIMVIKGVLIEKECRDYGIELIRPLHLRKKLQYSSQEASIARVRTHIEKSIQRIKIFKIFRNKLDWSLVPLLNEMMTVACVLVNLSKTILSDDEFCK